MRGASNVKRTVRVCLSGSPLPRRGGSADQLPDALRLKQLLDSGGALRVRLRRRPLRVAYNLFLRHPRRRR